MPESRALRDGLDLGGGMRSAPLAFGDQLGPDHGDLPRRLDAQPYLASLDPDDRDADVIPYEQLLHQLAGQDEHVWISPQGSLEVHNVAGFARLVSPRRGGPRQGLLRV
jgi:hypothetical protein